MRTSSDKLYFHDSGQGLPAIHREPATESHRQLYCAGACRMGRCRLLPFPRVFGVIDPGNTRPLSCGRCGSRVRPRSLPALCAVLGQSAPGSRLRRREGLRRTRCKSGKICAHCPVVSTLSYQQAIPRCSIRDRTSGGCLAQTNARDRRISFCSVCFAEFYQRNPSDFWYLFSANGRGVIVQLAAASIGEALSRRGS